MALSGETSRLLNVTVPSGARSTATTLSRKNWSSESMERALMDVTNGTLSVRRAAIEYNVPRSTLHDRVSGRVVPGAVSGAPKYLTDDEEEEVVRFLIGCAEVGCAKSVREVRGLVGAIVARKHGLVEFVVSNGWWDRFRARHPQLTLRAGESLAYRGWVAINREVIDHYYDLLEETVRQNRFGERPSLIFNCDESGFPLQHRPGNRIAKRGMKHVYNVNSGNKTQITVLACANATGCVIPPMVIFNRKNLVQELTRGEVPGTMYGLSPNSGWIDSELFFQWFERHFLVYAPAGRPLLLILDGHSSHFEPEFIRLAVSKGVIVFVLPPHTTHLCQPLDLTCFHSLKSYWDEECDKYMVANPGKVVTVYQFSQLFSAAWVKAMTPQTIMSGFRTTGIYPVNRDAIHIPGEPSKASAVTPMTAIAKNSGIQFLPLYSPAPSKKKVSAAATEFAPDELQCFERRFEEGYDLTIDEKYNNWLERYHPEHAVKKQLFSDALSSTTSPQPTDTLDPPLPSDPSSCTDDHSDQTQVAPPSCATTKGSLHEFLRIPSPPAARKTSKPDTAKTRVITSAEYLQMLEQKEQEKKDKLEEKERRKKEREEKAKARAAEKERKKKERQEKAATKAMKSARNASMYLSCQNTLCAVFLIQ